MKKAKDINKNVVAEDYENVLFNGSYMAHEKNRIQIKDHNIGTYGINSISLLCYDHKKYIFEDGYRRLSHFHKSAR